MTAPDPIREALVEAGKAVRLRARFSPLTGQALSEDFAAHAITAFHRRLAETSPCEIDAEISSELADAVEAARERRRA